MLADAGRGVNVVPDAKPVVPATPSSDPGDPGYLQRDRHALDGDLARVRRHGLAGLLERLDRRQDLPGASERPDPGRHVDADPAEVLAASRALGRMDPDSNGWHEADRSLLVVQGALDRHG